MMLVYRHSYFSLLIVFLLSVLSFACSTKTSNQSSLDPAEMRLLLLQKQREELTLISKITSESEWQKAFQEKKAQYDSKNVSDYQHLLQLFEALIQSPVFQQSPSLQKQHMSIQLYPPKILGKLDNTEAAAQAYLKLAQALDIEAYLPIKEEALFFAAFQYYEMESYQKAITIWQRLVRHHGDLKTSTSLSSVGHEGIKAEAPSNWVKNAEWYYAWSLFLIKDQQAGAFLESLALDRKRAQLADQKTEHRSALYWASEAYQASKQFNKANELRAMLIEENKLDYYSLLLMKKYPLAYDFSGLLPHEQKKKFFQTQYQSEVDEWLQSFSDAGLTRWQIFSFILKESNFNAKATSKANAMGLMQLLQKTGDALVQYRKDQQKQDEISAYSVPVDLYEPRQNISLGVMYLSLLHQQYQQQLPLTALAYNAGPTALKKWITGAKTKGNRVALDLFIERIPYKEAREYVKKVLEFEVHYRLFYQNEALESIAKSLTMLLNLEINETILF
jgi:soluble lytic murein transglycosylase-like protein